MPEKIKLGPLEAIPRGGSRCYEHAGTRIAVFHTAEGVFALDDLCPHHGGPLSEGFFKEGRVACPWHQWEFSLQTGQCTTVPSLPVKNYPVEINDGQIWLILKP